MRPPATWARKKRGTLTSNQIGKINFNTAVHLDVTVMKIHTAQNMVPN